jgi:DNA modification methylase
MTDRIVEMSCQPGMTLVDPFAGSGSTLVSALSAHVNFIAGDIVSANCDLMSQRVLDALNLQRVRRANGTASERTAR